MWCSFLFCWYNRTLWRPDGTSCLAWPSVWPLVRADSTCRCGQRSNNSPWGEPTRVTPGAASPKGPHQTSPGRPPGDTAVIEGTLGLGGWGAGPWKGNPGSRQWPRLLGPQLADADQDTKGQREATILKTQSFIWTSHATDLTQGNTEGLCGEPE